MTRDAAVAQARTVYVRKRFVYMSDLLRAAFGSGRNGLPSTVSTHKLALTWHELSLVSRCSEELVAYIAGALWDSDQAGSVSEADEIVAELISELRLAALKPR